MGDCAYGDGNTRQKFADAGRTLIAKVMITVGRVFQKESILYRFESHDLYLPGEPYHGHLDPQRHLLGPDRRDSLAPPSSLQGDLHSMPAASAVLPS